MPSSTRPAAAAAAAGGGQAAFARRRRRRHAPVATLALLGVLAGSALLLPSCAWDGHFDVAGYSTRPNYDLRFETIRVPIFRNRTFWTVTPVPGMEMDLTRAVVREVELRTPYKVRVESADTELSGAIIGLQKSLLNYTPFNTIREAELTMTVALVWRACASGEVLLKEARRPGDPIEIEPREPILLAIPPGEANLNLPGTPPLVTPGTPQSPLLPNAVPVTVLDEGEFLDPVTGMKASPVLVRSVGYYRPELGESITTALQECINRMATNIVSVMESGNWARCPNSGGCQP